MSPDTTNPYVGLRPFDVDESLLFFGRSDQCIELLERLHQHHFVAVVGSSGGGKSSLLRAGLIPTLKAGYLVDYYDQWIIAIMKPGQSPLYNLAESTLLQINPDADISTVTTIVQKIEEKGVDALLDLITSIPKHKNNNFFLLVDQFEELFRFAGEQKDVAKKDEAIDFVNILLELSKQRRIPFYVVITMRSDFIGDCTEFYGLPEAMNQSQYIVPRLNRIQLKTVIEGPAKLYGGKVNPALTSRLLNDIGRVKDELPLLQHALMRIWDYEVFVNRSGELDLLDYERIGGIEKALSNHADDALGGRSTEDLLAIKKIFQSLTAIDETGRKIRRPVVLSQLELLTGIDKEKLLDLISLFVKDKRTFLVINKASDTGEILIDISHESLIRQWSTLSGWVDEEAESASNYLQIAEASKLNQQKKKDLLTGSELQFALDWNHKSKPIAAWAKRYKEDFEESIDYLNRSEDEKIAKQNLEKARKQQRRNLIVAIMGLLLLIAIGAIFATKVIKTQYQAFVLHFKAQEIIKTDPTLALRLEEVALEKQYNSFFEALAVKIYYQNPFYKIIGRHSNMINSVAFSPDGKTILTGSLDNTARLWDLKGNILKEFIGHSDEVSSVAFSPEGKTILTGSWDNTIRLWNLKGDMLKEFTGHTAGITSVAFSPDGKTILTASEDGTASRWNLKGDGLPQINNYNEAVHFAVFSPNGNTILTCSDKSTRLWNLEGMRLKEFKDTSGNESKDASGIYYIAFSPDGEKFLTSSYNGTVSVWDLKGKILQEYKFNFEGVSPVAFSADGETILIGFGDGKARIWNLKDQSIKEFKGHTGPIRSVSFSPDGKSILTGSEDYTARLWDLNLITTLQKFKGHSDRITSIAFSPDEKSILTGSEDMTARLWNLKGDSLLVFTGHSDAILSVAFSPDGKTILTGSRDNTARLWDLEGKTLKEFIGSQYFSSVAFSPDGKTILTCIADTVRLWDLKGKSLQEFYGHSDVVNTVAFSPDGNTILTGSSDHTARLWDLNGKTLQEFKGYVEPILSLAFSPDGKTILTSALDIIVRLWDLKGNILQEFDGHSNAVRFVTFSPDGKTILTGSDDFTARLWDLKGNTLHVFEGHSDGVNTAVFSPDGKTVLTGSGDASARLWATPMPLKDFLKSNKIERLSDEQKRVYGIK